MSYFCGAIENEILFISYKFLKDNNAFVPLKNILLEYDGLCFKPTVSHDDLCILIAELNNNIKRDTGLTVKMALKNYKPFYIHTNIIDNYNKLEIQPPSMIKEKVEKVKKEEKEGCSTDKEAAETLYRLHPYWVTSKNQLYVFDNDTGMWSSERNIHYKVISKYSSDLHVAYIDSKGERKISPKSYGNSASLIEKIIKFLEIQNIDDNWIDSVTNSSVGKLLFKNGYFDGYKDKFYAFGDEEYDKNIAFFAMYHIITLDLILIPNIWRI